MSLNAWTKTATLGLALGTVAIAGCAGMTHSMDVHQDESGQGHLDHEGMEHGAMGHDATQTHTTAPANKTHDGQGSMEPGHGHAEMHHGALEIPAGQVAPQLNLSVTPDAIQGWNLHAAVENFAFAPGRVNQESGTTEGHAHLFINGEKITRLYGPWYYIASLSAGEHEIRVELNANGHEVLKNKGEPIAATVKVVVAAP